MSGSAFFELPARFAPFICKNRLKPRLAQHRFRCCHKFPLGNAPKFPEYQTWLHSLLSRFVDLYDVFEDFSYYHPSQDGSASLKANCRL
jgi:hypothetical protein